MKLTQSSSGFAAVGPIMTSSGTFDNTSSMSGGSFELITNGVAGSLNSTSTAASLMTGAVDGTRLVYYTTTDTGTLVTLSFVCKYSGDGAARTDYDVVLATPNTNVTSWSGAAVGALPTNFSSLSIDSSGYVTMTSGQYNALATLAIQNTLSGQISSVSGIAAGIKTQTDKMVFLGALQIVNCPTVNGLYPRALDTSQVWTRQDNAYIVYSTASGYIIATGNVNQSGTQMYIGVTSRDAVYTGINGFSGSPSVSDQLLVLSYDGVNYQNNFYKLGIDSSGFVTDRKEHTS